MPNGFLQQVRITTRPYTEFMRSVLASIGIKYDTVYIIRKRVTSMQKMPAASGIRTSIATKQECMQLGIADVSERLARNELCFLVWVEDEIAGYAWLNTGDAAYIPDIEDSLPLGKKEAYQYDARIFPQFRGKGLHKHLITARLNYLFKKGFSMVYGFISKGNFVSLKGVRSFQYEVVKQVRFLRLLFHKNRWELLPKN